MKGHDLTEGQAALQDIRAALERTAITSGFLKAKLNRVNAVLMKASAPGSGFEPADLERIETEYLDIVTAVQPGLKDADAVILAKRIKKLDIRLRAHVH
jgi:hypothetical protein